jgi:hypothetical protein
MSNSLNDLSKYDAHVTDAPRTPASGRFWDFGERIAGYEIPVFNEREVRASAGILFLFGIVAYVTVLQTGDVRPMQGFAILFLFDMFLRLFVSPRLSPTMILGRLAVYRQRPEWVGAPQKRVAWGVGLGLAMVSCATLGLLAMPVIVALVLCGICLTVLFLETAFGICVGCELYRVFSREKPLYCPGDSCNYSPAVRS